MASPKPITITDGEGLEIELATRFEVCDRCEGSGSHVNPSIDGNGLSREDFDEDPDFEEAYFAGRYDVPCYECRGERVITVVDESRCSAAELELWYAHLQSEADYRAEVAMERRMGC